MNRLGLIDFWYYTNDEFHFKNGHMLLRGSNGSGKSVTMQSFIPLLLDGNKSSERLDPFGTRSRKIENYLLDENDGRDNRIAYLYLEFKREDSEAYTTIGMGLHARKGKPVDSWYFVIEDNRRVNIDIQLMEHNLAITKQQLKNILHEQVIESQKSYMEKVNQTLFGFETLDTYKEAITLLLQLRSPKLSNSLKPTMINDVLSDSLQPLSEEDLRPMSEAITNMDTHKDRIDALNQSMSSVQAILKVYEKYNYTILLDKYHKFEKESKSEHNILLEQDKNHKIKNQKENELQLIEKETIKVENEQAVLQTEQNEIGAKDVALLIDEITMIETTLKERHRQGLNKEEAQEKKSNQLQDVKVELQNIENEAGSLYLSLKEQFKDIDDIQESLLFTEHDAMKEDVWKDIKKPYDYTYTFQQIEHVIKEIQEGLHHFGTYHSEKDRIELDVEQKVIWVDQLERLQSELKQQEEQYRSIIEEYKEKFINWNDGNEVLHLEKQPMDEIMNTLRNYEENSNYASIKDLIHNAYQVHYTDVYSKILHHEKEIEELNNMLANLQQEIHSWETRKDIIPLQKEAVTKSRKKLLDHHVECKPFYKLLEFDEQVNDDTKATFEELLATNGLLDALVVCQNDREVTMHNEVGTSDAYLFVKQEIKEIKELYITGNDMNMICKQLCNYLSYFGIEYRELVFNERTYQYGIVEGTFSKDQPSIYIGERARELFRTQKLEVLHKEYERLHEQKKDQEKLKNQKQALLDKLDEEKGSYPQEQDISSADKQVKDVRHELWNVSNDIQKLEQQIQKKSLLLKDLYVQLQAISKRIMMNCDEVNFRERLKGFYEYKSSLLEFDKIQQRYQNKLDIMTIRYENYEMIVLDLDNINVEVGQLNNEIDKLKLQKQNKQQQLEQLGYNKIQQRMKEIALRLAEIPALLSRYNQQIGTLRTELKDLAEDIEKNDIDLAYRNEQKQKYFQVLKQEIQLHYIIGEDVVEKDWLKLLANMTSTETKRSSELANDLQMSVYNNRDTLQENNLTIKNILPCEQLEDIAERIDIEARYRGNRISLIQLRLNLYRDIELEESLLLESDKTLFEEILVNVISKQIRRHIQTSTFWVDRMNRYMADMNTSSTLQLSLKWEKKKSEEEHELHTRELIELLQMDPLLMKTKDKDRLSNHFRDKIKLARKQQEENGNTMSFHQLMRDAMDYRKWFEFKIMSQKAGEKKKELTNNLFFSYSGGEKAMSMYVPLFSAVAAKFESARDDAPLLIALDEAFAGVDDKNIYNMFALIGKFKFDYIINSQVLWGDYGSVRALSIYELFRPENARYVTCISYEWDGKEKRMIA